MRADNKKPTKNTLHIFLMLRSSATVVDASSPLQPDNITSVAFLFKRRAMCSSRDATKRRKVYIYRARSSGISRGPLQLQRVTTALEETVVKPCYTNTQELRCGGTPIFTACVRCLCGCFQINCP